jgi:hypothetical protein
MTSRGPSHPLSIALIFFATIGLIVVWKLPTIRTPEPPPSLR